VKGGVVGSTNRAIAGAWPTSALTYQSYGGSSDLWGETWTPADINASNFGLVLSVNCADPDDNEDQCLVDHFRITVFYSVAVILDPTVSALAALRALPFIEVVELVKVSWQTPDGDIYYVSTLDPYLLRGLTGGLTLEARLPGRTFQEILNDATIADDKVSLKLWDGDGKISDLATTHGSGQRGEIFYWFPQIALLLSQYIGHLQPPTEAGIDWYTCDLASGFMSSMLPLPRRALYTGCQNMFGGRLKTQAEIDEGGCPYNLHLTQATLVAFDPAHAANVDTSSGIIKNAGGSAWNAGASHATAVTAGDDAVIEVVRGAPYAIAGFSTVNNPTNFTDFLVGLQWNPDGSLTIQYNNGTAQRGKAAATVSGDTLRVEIRAGRFRVYIGGREIVLGDWSPPAPAYPLYLGIAIQNVSSGVTAANVLIGDIGPAPAIGLLDPATGLPFTECPRTRPASIARLGDDLSYLGFDTIIQSYTVGQTKGSNITVTTRGNESNLKRPLRVIYGERDVQDLDLLAYTVEPDTKHPEGGFVACLFAVSEGPIQEMTKCAVNGAEIEAMHLNIRLGELRQPRTSFSASPANYSGTALCFGRAGPGDFTQTQADQLRGSCHVKGKNDVRRYTNAFTYVEEYSVERAWALLDVLRNKRWGLGYDVSRFEIQDWIDLDAWAHEIVSFTDADGTHYTSQRTQFHAELIDRSAQQQVNDICLAGRFSLPYLDQGKRRIKPLRAFPELFTPMQFTDKAFLGSLNRLPTTGGGGELPTWVSALNTAIASGAAALVTTAATLVKGRFQSAEYIALATPNDVFVTNLYAAYLGRLPDALGQVWISALDASSLTRSQVEDDFGNSDEFGNRVRGMLGDSALPYFTDRGSSRNICWENDKTTLVRQIASDAEVPNRIIVNFDDTAHGNAQRPLTFEDIDAQLRAGYASGDTSRRAVEKTYTALGVTDIGEAVRLGNILLHLGEFDEGGTINNLRIQFTTWFSECLTLRKYQGIKVESDRMDRMNAIRADQGLPSFKYFRIRSMRRMPDLKVQISAQAYAQDFYDLMESWTQPPPIIGTPGGGNPGGDLRLPPFRLGILSASHDADRITFQLES
jgi:hypothetical protein